MSSVLPPDNRLTGHYSYKNELYSVHFGAPQVVLKTPSPTEAPPFESGTLIPNFLEPRYLTPRYAYMLFTLKYPPWRENFFSALDFSRAQLPIVQDDDHPGRFKLETATQKDWLHLEISLRNVGFGIYSQISEMKYPRLGNVVTPYGFSAVRYKFLQNFPTEASARFAAWRSKLNFLPLIAYVSMAFWIAEGYDQWCQDNKVTALDWRAELLKGENAVQPAFLEILESTTMNNWRAERVGCLYQIPDSSKYESEEQWRTRYEVEYFLKGILLSEFPIPLYISWGTLPSYISESTISAGFKDFIPAEELLDSFYAAGGKMSFSRYSVSWETKGWVEYPYKPAPSPIAAAPPLHATHSSPPPVNPFPPRPEHSAQRENESIFEFFARRGESNKRKMETETSEARQRRTQRLEHAKKGGLPAGTSCAFFWEEQGGHYIRKRVNRGEYTDYWAEYPRSQRRFDPIHNEWDLCVLFEKKHPVFGRTYDDDQDPYDSEDDDYDNVDQHPTFPQGADMATFLPLHVPGDVEMESEEFVPEGVDLGHEFDVSDLPLENIASSSKKCVERFMRRFNQAPSTENPTYESIGQNLLDVLQNRFGFVKPRSLDKHSAEFTPRDAPKKPLPTSLLPDVVGVPEIGSELASENLSSVLSIFFGQHTDARTANDIDRVLLDYHDRDWLPPSPFDFGRESLTSMRTGTTRSYYVLRQQGSGIGSEVLLFPRATDLLEVLRRGWGPGVKDVVKHLLARGTTFWFAWMSAQIESGSPLTQGKRDVTSGLGYRPQNFEFEKLDYTLYVLLRENRVLHGPRGRIALQYGGAVARLARAEISDVDFLQQFDDAVYDLGDCLWDGKSQHAYWHEFLTNHELDILCGVYHVGTGIRAKKAQEKEHESDDDGDGDGEQTSITSWWPKPHAWARGSLAREPWTFRSEQWYQKRLQHFADGVYLPTTTRKWRKNLRFNAQVLKCLDGCERVAEKVVDGLIARVDVNKAVA
ncbi:hypothetical protein B0H16DRAFT_1887617 [Mycena metata]|uniref:Uncharacterized protein n=1 Tax=Mycena metata TaxID=1033252 RepID=A0AAD7IV15_9AGAR|nr:hypothetical protein B0H16DRAFT_1887617 [Mycena metata]